MLYIAFVFKLFLKVSCVHYFTWSLNSTAYVKDQRLNKLKIRARRFELMEKFYSLWKEKVQHRAEEKIEETGKEVKWP